VNPNFAKACVRDGHEIATHGLRWLDIWDYDLDKEKEYIIQSLKVLKEVSGEMPVGAYYGRGTPNTKALFPEVFKEAGSEMLWNSEAYNDDVPYWTDLPAEKDLPDDQKKGMLVLPYNYDCNDGKFHMSPGGSSFYSSVMTVLTTQASLAATCTRNISSRHLICSIEREAG
jgi:peptidoglycan/xylan/chitin deacetylase (PgdA/CDA1 family)